MERVSSSFSALSRETFLSGDLRLVSVGDVFRGEVDLAVVGSVVPAWFLLEYDAASRCAFLKLCRFCCEVSFGGVCFRLCRVGTGGVR